MTEPSQAPTPTAQQLAELALELEPHHALLCRALPHLDLLLRATQALQGWDEVESALATARQAPADFQAEFHRVVFERLTKKHGGNNEFWGALARAKRVQQGIPTPTTITITRPTSTPHPNPNPAATATGFTATPASPIVTEPNPSPTPEPTPTRTPENDAAGAGDRGVEQELAAQFSRCRHLMAVLGLGAKELSERIASLDLGLTLNPNVASSIRTGWAERRALEGFTAMSRSRLKDLVEVLELMVEAHTQPSPTPTASTIQPQAQVLSSNATLASQATCPAPTPTPTPKPKHTPPPGTRRERLKRLTAMLEENRGQVKLMDVARALELDIGPTTNFLKTVPFVEYAGNKTYRLAKH